VKIEELTKDCKTHQCTLGFDKGFIKAAIMKITTIDSLLPSPISLMVSAEKKIKIATD
jgi:hypothetical protein